MGFLCGNLDPKKINFLIEAASIIGVGTVFSSSNSYHKIFGGNNSKTAVTMPIYVIQVYVIDTGDIFHTEFAKGWDVT